LNITIVDLGFRKLEKNNNKSVCVFCGSRDGANPKYKQAAIELGVLLSEAKFRLVYGGGNVGLMGALASSAQDNNCEILGIIPRHLMEKEVGKADLQNLIVTSNMHERKQLMYTESDSIIVLPGGVGTLDEFFEIITWAQLGLHKKSIVLLNSDGFWDPLLNLLNHQIRCGFMDKSINELFSIAETPEEAIDYVTD
jgi:uncharacterized protein (TIGR00730 family)